jgi:hypothetical protein
VWERPQPTSLQRLQAILQQGDVAAIEEWIEETQEREPNTVAFTTTCQRLLKQMDLSGIQALLAQK